MNYKKGDLLVFKEGEKNKMGRYIAQEKGYILLNTRAVLDDLAVQAVKPEDIIGVKELLNPENAPKKWGYFEVGTVVYDLKKKKWGHVRGYEDSALRVHFGNTHSFYTLDGRYSIKDKERVLAYSDPKKSKVLVFPKDILDLDRLPKGTPILIEQIERTILHPGKVCYIALFEENSRTWSTGKLSSELFSSYFSKLISSAGEDGARNFHGTVKLYSPEMDY